MATADNLGQSLLDASDELVETACTICLSRDNKLVEAAHYCVECDGNLCKPCKNWHEEFRGTSGHQVLDVSMTAGRGGLPAERCEEHHGYMLGTYCPIHEQLCCVSCVAFKHRKCGNVQYISKLSKGIKKSQECNEVLRSVKDVTIELETIRNDRIGILNKLSKEENKSQSSLQEHRKRLIKRIDDLTIAESDKIKSKYQKLRDDVENDIKAVDDQIEMLKTDRKKLDYFRDVNESQLFIYVKQNERNKTEGKELINDLVRVMLPLYTIDSTIEKNLFDITELGRFKKEPSLTLEAEHSVSIAEDKKVCDIRGVCLLADGSVLLADYTNRVLKQFDNSYKMLRFLDMSASPFDVCYTENNNEVAVTLNMEKVVQFVCVGASLTKTRSFSVDEYCRGICCSNEELFICCENITKRGSAKICVFTLAGTRLRTIQVNQIGEEPHTFMRYITANSNGSKFYVAHKCGVSPLDKQRKIMSSYKFTGFESINGICAPDGDCLLIADRKSNSILYIPSDGKYMSTVLREQDRIQDPQALCYDHVNKKLIISAYGSNTIKVYKEI